MQGAGVVQCRTTNPVTIVAWQPGLTSLTQSPFVLVLLCKARQHALWADEVGWLETTLGWGGGVKGRVVWCVVWVLTLTSVKQEQFCHFGGCVCAFLASMPMCLCHTVRAAANTLRQLPTPYTQWLVVVVGACVFLVCASPSLARMCVAGLLISARMLFLPVLICACADSLHQCKRSVMLPLCTGTHMWTSCAAYLFTSWRVAV